MPVIICDTDKIKQGDNLEVDLEKGIVKDLTNKAKLKFPALPKVMTNILKDGGLVEHIKKHGDFKLD